MTSKAGTKRSSDSYLTALVNKEGALPSTYQGRDTTDEDQKLLMSTAILAGTEVEGRRANLAVKNLMELLTSLVAMTTKYVIKNVRSKNQYILDNDAVRAHTQRLLDTVDGPPV